jgi:hypothetical protein
MTSYEERFAMFKAAHDAMRVTVPEIDEDGVRVRRFTVGRYDLQNIRYALREGRGCHPGQYTRLDVDGQLWMSDTTAEQRDHMEAVHAMIDREARRVLINGLGLGMVVSAALALPFVEHVDVVERDARVARLIGPHYTASGRVTVHVADAYEQMKRWSTGTRWDVGWSDIWPDMSEDSLPDMARLNRSYGRRCGWHRCWGRDTIIAHRNADRRTLARWGLVPYL